MKRPFFCVALAYALGEVIAFYTKTVGETSIAVVMLVCVGIFMWKKKKSVCVLGLAVCLGMLSAFLRVPQAVQTDISDKQSIIQETNYRIITYALGVQTQGEAFACVGVLTDKQGDTWTMRILEGDRDTGGGYVLLRGVEEKHMIAEIVYVMGSYYEFENAKNPGSFQSCNYYLARNIGGYYYAPQVSTLSVDQRNILGLPRYLYYKGKRALYSLRTQIDNRITKLLPAEAASLVSGMLLGERTRIEPEIKTLYQMGGIAHILAISGLHISLLGGLLFRLMRQVHVSIPIAGVITILGILLYGVMTGMSLATIRAIWMMVILLVAQMFGKSYDMPTAMGIAMFFMLLYNPVRILDAGMQLSYMAIAGISLGNYGMRRLHKKAGFRRFQKQYPLRFRIVQSLIYSVTLQGMMLPLLAKNYYEIPVYAGLLNLIVVPGMTVVVAGSWCGLFVSISSVPLSRFIMLPVGWMLQGYTWLCERTLELPGNSFVTGEIKGWQIVVWYGGIACTLVLLRTKTRNKLRDFVYKHTGRFWRKREVMRYTVCVVMISVLIQIGGQALYVWQQRAEAIYFLDVGQGDGILIRSPDGRNLVIDGGSTSQSKCGTYTLLPALRSQGMTEIDCWFVTHTDEDHISGLKELLLQGKLAQIKVRAIVFSAYVFRDEALEELEAMIRAAGITIVWMKEGDVIGDDTFTLTCLHPTADYHAKDKNAASLALAYHSNTFDVLFTGDMDADAIADMGIQRDYDCIKLPHHGSKYSYVEGVYAHADYGLISCGYKNRYGHPHAEVLQGLAREGTQILRTDEMGAVVFRGR